MRITDFAITLMSNPEKRRVEKGSSARVAVALRAWACDRFFCLVAYKKSALHIKVPIDIVSAIQRIIVSMRPKNLLLVFVILHVLCADSLPAQSARWVASWTAAPCAFAEDEPRSEQFRLRNRTIREIVHLTAGGAALRVRLSNTFGTEPLVIDAARVGRALRDGEADAAAAMDITVAGQKVITVAAGKSVLSDPVALPTKAGSEISVSLYLSKNVIAPAIHYMALQTSYIADGDQTASAKLTSASKSTVRLILTAVDVSTAATPFSIVAIGSSTTDGAHSTPNTNRRWTDDLFRRLQASAGEGAPAVVNAGIAGNRVLHHGRGSWGNVWGDSALVRFNRDVLAQSGVKYVIAFEGGNDLRPGNLPPDEMVTSAQMIAAFRLMAKATHDRGAKFIAATITPAEQSDKNHPDGALWERSRREFNAWVLSSHEIDGFIDFSAAIADPAHPSRILARYDSGDHLHPNDEGYQAMADSIDLGMFLQAKP